MNRSLFIFLIFLGFVLSNGSALGESLFDLRQIYENGEIRLVVDGIEKSRIGFDITSGYKLYGAFQSQNNIYIFKESKELVIFSINGKQKEVYQIGKKLTASELPAYILYVNKNKILISSYQPWKNKKNLFRYTFYWINLDRMNVTKAGIDDNFSGWASVYRDSIYYTNLNNEICIFDGKRKENSGIYGVCPTISPDGSKLAYISKNIVFERLVILDLIDKEKNTILSSFGSKSIVRRIRWSENGSYLAVSKFSDLAPKPLFVIAAGEELGKVIFKVPKDLSFNWFLD